MADSARVWLQQVIVRFSIVQLEEFKHQRVKEKGHLHEDANEKSLITAEILELHRKQNTVIEISANF